MVSGDAAPEAVFPPGELVTVYELMATPPLDEGALKATTTWVLPAVALLMVGASGGPVGVTAVDGAEAGLEPPAFFATTVKV